MQDDTMQMPANARALLLPYSEETMRYGVGGLTMYGALVSPLMVQLYNEDGSPYLTPITREGAGWDRQPCYLVIHGDVEVSPGRFQKGILSSSFYPSRVQAEERWCELVESGIYEPPFEQPEFRPLAPTVAEVLGS